MPGLSEPSIKPGFREAFIRAGLAGLIALALFLGEDGGAMTLTSGYPGNLFEEGSPVVLGVSGASGTVSFEAFDFSGKSVASGKADGEIRLGLLGPGWYRVQCRTAGENGETEVFLGVVMKGSGSRLNADGRVAGDAAAAWLVPRDKWKDFAKIVRKAGLPWVRERLRWRDVEKEPGKFTWGKYRDLADIYAAEGIRVCSVWHDAPDWTRTPGGGLPGPDDLRTIYRFARAAAAEFRNSVQAWEVWNEPDIFFWADSSSRYAGVLRASARGLHDGNPSALILSGSLCSGAGLFASHLYGMAAFQGCDRFNWHLYKPPEDYPDELDGYRRLWAGAGNAFPPAWMTEAGIRLPGMAGKDSRLLDAERLREQARFVTRSVAMSLSAGDERHFFFVLPDYLENGNQFGALLPDLTPAPAFLALSACANILGGAEPLGRFPAGEIQAWVFRTPRGLVLVAWADQPGELSVPADSAEAELLDLFGAARKVKAEGGFFRVPAGPESVYLLFPGKEILSRLEQRARPADFLRRKEPGTLAMSARADIPFDKDRDAYRLGPAGQPAQGFDWPVELCNLAGKARARGRVSLDLPAGWRAEPDGFPFELDPQGRLAATIRLVPGTATLEALTVTATARPVDGPPVAVASAFLFDDGGFQPAGEKPLDWGAADRWKPAVRGSGGLSFSPAGDGMVAVMARREGKGDWWLEAEFGLAGPVDLSGFDAIACDLSAPAGMGEQDVFLMVDEAGGAVRMAGQKAEGERKTVRYLFRDLGLASRRITRVRLGVWTGEGAVAFNLGRFKLIKLVPPSVGGKPQAPEPGAL